APPRPYPELIPDWRRSPRGDGDGTGAAVARRARRLAAALQREPRMLAYRVRRRGAVTVVSLAPRVRLFETLLPRELTQWARLAANREIAVHRGRYVLATQQQAVTVWHLAAQTADAVAGALDTGGVQFFAMHLPNTRLTRWGVRRDQLESLAKVLSNELGAQGYYYSLGRSEPVRLVRAGLT